ncbi:MAG: rhomboid family intramembrane serine protease [Deltaproteobacteria bacterium]
MGDAAITVRTDRGEEPLELDEFEQRVTRGEIAPQCPVRFPALHGDRWVPAGSLELFARLYSPRKLHFSGAFTLGGIPWMTSGFIALCLAWYLAARLRPVGDATDTLVAYGAKAGPLLLDLGQLWRLLAANLVHKDAVHIAVNLFVLFNFAGAIEAAFRPLDMALVFLTSALGTTVGSFLVGDPASAGASGVAYGALGGAAVFGIKYRDILPKRYRLVLGGAVIPTVLVFLVIGWTSAGVDNWGHLGGLAGGAATVALLKPRMLSDAPRGAALWLGRLLPVGLLLGLPLGLGPLVRTSLPILEPHPDPELGVVLPVPIEWRQGADRLGRMAFFNGLSGYGHARVSVGGGWSEAPPSAELLATAWVDGDFAKQAALGRLSAFERAPARPVTLGGRGGIGISLRWREDGTDYEGEAIVATRGRLVTRFEAVWAAGEPGYGLVFEKIERAFRFIEPTRLERARAALLLAPDSEDAARRLAGVLADLGESSPH